MSAAAEASAGRPLQRLPSGWTWARLGDICDAVNGRAFKSSEWRKSGLPIVRIQNLKDSEAEFNYFTGELDERHRVRHGDLLFAWSGTPGTSFGAHIWKGPDAALNQHIFNIKFDADVLDSRYFCLALNQNVSRYVAQAQGGVGLAHITKSKFLDSFIPLAPKAKQLELVAELEKQFSRLDEAVANLKRVKANLRNLRASALNAACEGPWPSIEFGSLARETLVGLDRGRDQQRPVGPGRRYVKMNNVSMDGVIQREGIVYVDASNQEATRFALRSGDILFNTRNSVELVGKSALVPPALEGALYNNNLMRIRTTPEIDSAFLAMQMCAPTFRRQLEKVKRATTSVAAIYQKDLVRVQVIVPPIAEQYRIVAEVERRLSIVREVEAEVDRNFRRTQALRQAVLRRAFAGEPEARIAA